MAPAPERTEGIIPALINTGGITGIVLDTFRNLLKRQEEEEQQAMPSEFTSDPAYFTNPGDLTPKNIEKNTMASILTPSNTPGGMSLGQAMPGGIFEDMSMLPINKNNVGSANVGGMSFQGPNADFITNEKEFFYPEEYTLPFTNLQVPSLGRFIESVSTGGEGTVVVEKLTPAGESLYNTLVNDQNLTRDEALEKIKSLDNIPELAGGGLIPPEKGPLPQGVGSLFQER